MLEWWRERLLFSFSPGVESLLGSGFVGDLRRKDFPEDFSDVVVDGWIMEDGSALLSKFKRFYFGSRASFPGPGEYELAVNGRGIPDEDMDTNGMEGVAGLLGRGTAFAWEVLYRANLQIPDRRIVSRVSAAPIMGDPGMFSGYVTFFSFDYMEDLGMSFRKNHEDWRIYISSEECSLPLSD
ncbi:hypothetical protein ACOQFV_07870 [Nocardiopsis changdeensis]|uniref:Uncharacterized protein n=1 Tax=Nocardiopsis changdeensis TaxID=2831969 RepID=A0ABX8BGS1_9ACTN|nr:MULTISPECIES: hypothetical protein [Nocardiopsis]QUX20523.1 hypothetical protein KGD84_18610 [Nocardiopsis changdeensis]QYX36454.1 hypothetical protein K1J57_28065 [Nocardiopsis sp. MT53]